MANSQEETTIEVERDVTGPRSLTRLLGLFGVLSRAPEGMSLAELNIALDTPKSSLLNLLRPLVADAYLLHGNGTYRLGPTMFRLSAEVLAAWDFPKMIRPFMEELCRRTEETVLLGVPDWAGEVISYVEVMNSPHPVRYQIPVGTTRPLYVTTGGRLLLAFADKKRQADYLSTVSFKLKTVIPITRKSLKKDIARIHDEGLSYSLDVSMKGLSAVAAPVFDSGRRCVAALSIAGPTDRFSRELESLKTIVKEVANRASGITDLSGSQ